MEARLKIEGYHKKQSSVEKSLAAPNVAHQQAYFTVCGHGKTAVKPQENPRSAHSEFKNN